MKRSLWLAALVPLVLTAAVYAPVGRFGFVELDDPYYVRDNPHLHHDHGAATVRYALTTFTGGNWHPLVWASYFADRALWDLAPGPMHAENAALHALSGVLVLLLLFDATGRLGRSAVCAAVFAAHPLHVESVAWVSERKDVLSTAWLLAATCCHVRFARTGRRAWYAGLLGCYALSLSAKSMGVTLPAVLLLLDAWPLGRLRGRAWPRVREKAPMVAMAVAVGVVAMAAQQSVGATDVLATTPAERLANAATSALRYLADTVWPTRLAAFYPYHPVGAATAVAAAAVLAAITILAVACRRRRPYLLTGWLWFVGTLVPVSGALVQIGMQARADRYVYFPSVGLSVAVVWLAADALAAVRWAGPAIATAAMALFAVVGRGQVQTWRDSTTLFTRAATVTDGNAFAWDELGREALARGDLRTATADLAAAVGADPGFASAHYHLGRCAMAAGRPADAVAAFATAARLSPRDPRYRSALADARAAGR